MRCLDAFARTTVFELRPMYLEQLWVR